MGKRSSPVAFKLGLAFTFGVIPTPAFAHLVNTKVGEFYAGMLHPLTSVEHLFPSLALENLIRTS
jgi:hydrogenase/urease accessory protein HupE